jgi:1-acyl-sn-glycerol-3-phosphate acyltransferase
MKDRGSSATHSEPSLTESSSAPGHADAESGFGDTRHADRPGGEPQDAAILPLRIARFLPRAIIISAMVLAGLLLVGFVYPFIGTRGRDLLNLAWSRCLLRVCGVRLIVRGLPLMQGAALVVANHVSWLDIFVINAIRPTAFVAKSEIRRWPIIGWLVAGAGTLFLQRGHRQALQTVGKAMQARFANNEPVGLFPEGTTTDGFSLLPFHGSLFEPARQADVPIQPVALRFLRHGRRDAFGAFIGEETLVGNLWRILGTRGLAVETVYLAPLAVRRGDGTSYSRQELASMARSAIHEGLNGDS